MLPYDFFDFKNQNKSYGSYGYGISYTTVLSIISIGLGYDKCKLTLSSFWKYWRRNCTGFSGLQTHRKATAREGNNMVYPYSGTIIN